MKKLPPIPIPLKQRWQDFRVQAIPVLICGAALFAVVLLWNEQAGPSTVAGQAESLTSEMTSPGSGLLTQLRVSRFEPVEAGERLGTIVVTPPEVLQSSLAVVQAEIDLTRLQLNQNQQRNAVDLEALRLDWLNERATLAIDRIALQQAERDFERVDRLFQNRMVSEDEFERVQSQLMTLRETVSQGEQLVEARESSLEELGIGGDGNSTPTALEATIKLQEERLSQLETQLKPVGVIAPISGTVGLVHRRNGEYVAEGEPILTIQSPRSERIIAYLREPLTVEPSIGMEVEVASRNANRQRVLARILAIGPQVEALPQESAFRRPALNLYESGLPIAISVPANLSIRPGELVDVTVRP